MKLVMAFLFLLLAGASAAQHNYLLVGTYTNGKSEGIYVYDFDSKTGKGILKSKIKASNPSFLAVSPTQQYIYAAFEEGDGKGSVGAYRFDKKDGSLQFINQQASGGDHPCYVAEDKTGKWVTVANYSGGSLSVHPVSANGGLGASTQLIQHSGSSVNKQRQEKAHVHCTYFSADNKYLFVPDLGMDKLMIYSFNSKTGKLQEAVPAFAASPDNGGPRHITFSPNQRYAYLMEELKGNVVVYRYNNGKLTQVQSVSAASPGFHGFMGSADIHTSADGKFLYCSNRGDANTISIFTINANDGTLKLIGQQSTMGIAPRNFSLDPTGNYLLVANQNSDNIVVFKRNKTTGLLTDSGERIEVGNPVCLKWVAP